MLYPYDEHLLSKNGKGIRSRSNNFAIARPECAVRHNGLEEISCLAKPALNAAFTLCMPKGS